MGSESTSPEAEVARLREQLEALQWALKQASAVGSALSDSVSGELVLPYRLEQTQGALRRAIEANRRQMGEISRIISRFMPQTFPVAAGLDAAGQCRPCHDVGGDIYEFLELDDHRVALCIADVAGHGARAMVAMSITRSLLRAAFTEREARTSPGEVLLRLSTWFRDQLDPEQFVTMWLGVWDRRTERITYAVAGHPPAVLWREGDAPAYLESDGGLPLGIAFFETEPYIDHTLEFNVGDRLILYTDGWTESASSDGKMLEEQHFLDFLRDSQGHPAATVPQLLFMMLERHAANSRIRDDISILVVDRVS